MKTYFSEFLFDFEPSDWPMEEQIRTTGPTELKKFLF